MSSTSKKNGKSEDFSLISRERLLALYAGLLRCNTLDSFIAANLSVRRSPARTRSAASVAACIDRLPGDTIAVPPRDPLPAFVAGKSLDLILAGLRTPARQQRAAFTAEFHAAIAAARQHHRNGNRNIVIVFGRPATGRQWQTTLRTASDECLPIIFVCKGQSHLRAVWPPRHLPAINVDRDDVVAIYRVASEGIAHARRGNGPTLIECVPWYLDVNSEPSSAVAKMEAYLLQKGISPARCKARVAADIASELASAGSAAGMAVSSAHAESYVA